MKMKCIRFAVFGAAVLAPSLLLGQAASDPNAPFAPTPPGGQSSDTTTNSANTMRETLGAPGLTGQQLLDKQFVRGAAAGGIADIQMGQLAEQKGDPVVKDLAQKLVDDHTSLNTDLASVADSMGVMLPGKMEKDDQAEYDKLKGLSGKDFDREYLDFMAKEHYSDLHNFHMEASVSEDTDLSAAVVRALGMMHQHLALITDAAKADGVVLPPRPPRPTAPTTAAK